jgi:hypothetical protein
MKSISKFFKAVAQAFKDTKELQAKMLKKHQHFIE